MPADEYGAVARAEPLLEVDDLQVAFKSREGVVRAVNGVSFTVTGRETLGIVGESGSGKSVSALALMRLLPRPQASVSARDVRFAGLDLFAIDERAMRHVRGARLAMVFQDPMTSLNPVLTIERQVAEMLIAHGICGREETRERARALLDMVGIPEPGTRLKAYPDELSGGMRQRVLIAMALSCGPELLIADEPTTALDVTVQDQVLDLMRRLKREIGMAIIWISHDLGTVAGLADRVLIMYAGRVMEEAPVRDLYRNPRHPYTRALLRSVPRLDGGRAAALHAIEGMPPDLVAYPRGCPFHARCPLVADHCRERRPELETIAPRHRVACWRHDVPGVHRGNGTGGEHDA